MKKVLKSSFKKLPVTNKKPQIIALEVTRHCRYHCPHCFSASADSDVDVDGELNTLQWKKIIRAIGKFCRCTIFFTGGEPMERPDIYELVKSSSKSGLKSVLSTCGYLINEKTIGKLKNAGLKALSFSLDGATAKTHDFFRKTEGSFDQIMLAAQVARRNKMPFQISSTICKLNLDEVNLIADLAGKIGARSFHIYILVPSAAANLSEGFALDPVEYESLLNHLLELKLTSPLDIKVISAPAFTRIVDRSNAEKRIGAVHGCIGGSSLAFIDTVGNVRFCRFLDISAANIVDENYNFKKIWENSELLNSIRDRSKFTGKCRRCEYVNLCGGCRARAYNYCGDFHAGDPLCGYKTAAQKPILA